MTSCLVTRSISSMRVDVEFDVSGLFPDVFGARLGDHADFGQGVAGVSLDLEPDLEPRLGSQMATISGRE